jgi:hypothetical protein
MDEQWEGKPLPRSGCSCSNLPKRRSREVSERRLLAGWLQVAQLSQGLLERPDSRFVSRLPPSKVPQDRLGQLDPFLLRGAAAAYWTLRRLQRDRALHDWTGLPYGRVAMAPGASGYVFKGEPAKLDGGRGPGRRLVIYPRLSGVFHDRQVLSRPREDQHAVPGRRRPHDHYLEPFSKTALIGTQDRRERGDVHERHGAEIEDDPTERLTPKGGEGRLHAPDGDAVEVTSNAEVDSPVPLMRLEVERVRFALSTCSLAPALPEDTSKAEWEPERTLGAYS